MTDVQAHLTDIIAERCVCSLELATHMAAVLLAEFDVLPKGELTEEWGFTLTSDDPDYDHTGEPITLRTPSKHQAELVAGRAEGRELMSRLVSGWKQQP